MTLVELRQKREDILRIAAKHGASNVRVFGSVARGEADETSDVDILIDMEEGRSLFDLGGVQIDLQDFIGCRVDIAESDGLYHFLRERVLKEAVPL